MKSLVDQFGQYGEIGIARVPKCDEEAFLEKLNLKPPKHKQQVGGSTIGILHLNSPDWKGGAQ